MKRSLIGAVVVLILALIGCSARYPFRAQQEFSHEVAWNDYEKLIVRSTNGAIDAAVEPRADLHISGAKSIKGPTMQEAEQTLEQIEIVFQPSEDEPGEFLILVRVPETLRDRSAGVNLVVRIPASCAAVLETDNGQVTLRGLRHDGRIVTRNGAITVDDVEGEVYAETSNGLIAARNVRGACTFRSSNGAIEALDIAGSVEARTTNGAILLRAAPPADGSVVLATSNGAIDAVLPRTMQAAIDLQTSVGGVQFDAPEGLSLEEVSASGTHYRAILNGGGGRIEARTSIGLVQVRLVE